MGVISQRFSSPDQEVNPLLFSFSCDGDGDKPLKTTVKNPTLFYDYMSEDEVNNKEYDIDLDIDKIGVLFYLMLFGVKPRKDKISFENRMEERLGQPKGPVINKILRGCLGIDGESRIEFDYLCELINKALD